MLKKEKLIIVRGAGDISTGTIQRLWSAGYRVFVLETFRPSGIRRQVALSEAVYQGQAVVEGATAVRIECPEQAGTIWESNRIPLMVDPDGACIEKLHPDIVVDAILAKRNLGTRKNMAPLTIGLGPGFVAGEDVHYVIETMRGHNLGRIITNGTAVPNTGVPGMVGGYAKERVLHADADGELHVICDIGTRVTRGDKIAEIRELSGKTVEVRTKISGIVRGMIREGFSVTKGFKIADVDPRMEELNNCYTISDKARCIAGSVLELVCREEAFYIDKLEHNHQNGTWYENRRGNR